MTHLVKDGKKNPSIQSGVFSQFNPLLDQLIELKDNEKTLKQLLSNVEACLCHPYAEKLFPIKDLAHSRQQIQIELKSIRQKAELVELELGLKEGQPHAK